MGREFSETNEVEVDATPEQVWQAIATGPGIDSWFMGRNEVSFDETAEQGTVRMAYGGYEPEHRVTTWEPLRRFAYRSDDAPDGRFIAYEFLIEGRGQGSTVLRMANSGFLPGDDWEAEYDAMTKGGALFFATLATYLRHFAGRTAVPVTAFGPVTTDWKLAWATLTSALGLAEAPRAGDRVHVEPDGLEPVDGEVYFVNAHTLGVRTGDALYRFLKGFGGPVVASHHLFGQADTSAAERAWQTWLDKTFT
ncbi:MAG: SRPBCC domain-containing protein [Actinophytocola sp.]|uniref:SRPBCC family protein n=1 Tax=Actinophytocola sp. TaxID=1872138 RepID=UPI0013276280|nr:SRPBCC domain-containing protein [Actinophytocola sp.]MPZ82150.1 SRPBCC domain-containing protein [Actinophytocola sp.]